jgi:hypothetical protein
MADQLITVELKGLDEVLARFGKGSEVVKREMGDALEEMSSIAHEAIANYTQDNPPHREGQTYVRTFTLKGSWTTEVNRPGLWAKVGTNLGYAPYVVGDGTQAWMHKGRWWTAGGKVTELQPIFQKIEQTAVDSIVEQMGG